MGFPSPDQLSCDNHPFFEGIQLLSTSVKAFYNSVLSSEGDIFEGYQITSELYRNTLLVGLLETVSTLSGWFVSQMPGILS